MPLPTLGRRVILPVAALAALHGGVAGAQRTPRAIPPAVARYFELVRPAFSGDRARDVVAFMEQYFRLPGNAGFDASIHHVEKILTSAGYVDEARAALADRLTYRIERRRMSRPTWEP